MGKVEVSLAVASAVLEDDMSKMGAPWLGGIAKTAMTQEIRYKKKEELGEAFAGIPPLSMALAMAAGQWSTMPQGILDALKGLEQSANGLTGIRLRGLPQSQELNVVLNNVHVAPVLA